MQNLMFDWVVMLKTFSVENFKGFQNKLTLDLEADSYDFNQEVIENSCISKGIVYDVNGSGKSNLGLALFDIIIHITERQKLMHSYDFYLNMSNSSSAANFEYEWIFTAFEWHQNLNSLYTKLLNRVTVATQMLIHTEPFSCDRQNLF